jgi:hypothetical protein
VPDAPPETVASHRGLVEDPADVPVALAAMAAGVDALVSSDRHLVGPAAASLQATLRTMSVHDCLRELLGLPEADLAALRGRTRRPEKPEDGHAERER